MRHVLDLGIQSIWLERHAALDRLGTEYFNSSGSSIPGNSETWYLYAEFLQDKCICQ